MPALTEITTEIPSGSAFSQPDQSGTAPVLARAQCEVLRETDAHYVVMLASMTSALQAQLACDFLDFRRASSFGSPESPGAQPPLAAVPRRLTIP